MLTLNVLLSLILQSKIVGKGKLGNGRILVKLLQVVSDNDSTKCSPEWNILRKFSDEQVKAYAYQRVDKLIVRFLPEGKHYPYDKFSFNEFENNFGESQLLSMRKALDEIVDESKINSLVYSLLELIRDDDEIDFVHYGGRYIHKEKLFGSYAHPKRICIEALLLGLLYHAHKNPVQESSGKIELLELPNRMRFVVERYKSENSLDLDRTVGLAKSIAHNSKRPYAFEKNFPDKHWYDLELYSNGREIIELPETGNLFIYGSGGSGKTTLLQSLIISEKPITFYLPLYKYHGDIAVQLLLKYYYQYEYQDYDEAAANEGEDEIIRSMTKLKALMKSPPIGGVQKYTLLLDGLNELSAECQEKLINELEAISNEWQNVRIIISGRTVPRDDLFSSFINIEVRGISANERDSVIGKNSIILQNKKLSELLRKPLFLNMYIDSQNINGDINTCGEILDTYFNNLTFISNKSVEFIVRYVLPFAAKTMLESYTQEIDRAELYAAIDKTYDTFIENETIYQNYIAPKKFNKKSLLESREKNDYVELIIENLGVFVVSITEPHKLHFVHQYYRDYFAAKYILNLLEALDSYGKGRTIEKAKFFEAFQLGHIWFSSDNHEIYELIGEICGDYKNVPHDDFVYHRTILDTALKMSREFDTFRLTENIIRVMETVRNGVICETDFSGSSLPMNIPCNIRFSDNGDYPSNFRNCRVNGIGILNDDIRCSVCSKDGTLLLVSFGDGYVVLWDTMQKKMIRDYDLSRYTSFGCEFEHAEVSSDNAIAELISFRSKVRIDLDTGEVISVQHGTYYHDTDDNVETLSDDLLNELKKQLPHFSNCDFSGATFLFDDDREFLKTTGAII